MTGEAVGPCWHASCLAAATTLELVAWIKKRLPDHDGYSRRPYLELIVAHEQLQRLMNDLPAISVVVCLAGLAIVFLLSIFALRHIVVRERQRASNAYRPLDHSYHDADSEATELSI